MRPVVVSKVGDVILQNRGFAFHTRDGFGDGVGYDISYRASDISLVLDWDGESVFVGAVFVGSPSKV